MITLISRFVATCIYRENQQGVIGIKTGLWMIRIHRHPNIEVIPVLRPHTMVRNKNKHKVGHSLKVVIKPTGILCQAT